MTRLRSVGLAVIVAAVGAVNADDGGWARKIRQLNHVTGQEAIDGKILELRGDRAALKAIVEEAVKLANAKDKTLGYNGAFILARTSHSVKDYANSEVLYKVCVEQAVRLHSGQKLIQVFDGLIDLFSDSKRYDDAVKACQEFLDIKSQDKAIENAKLLVMERMIHILSRQNKHPEALRMAQRLVELDEGGWYFLRLQAEVLHAAGRDEESAKVFLDVIDKVGKSELTDEQKGRVVERCRYILSSVYVDLKLVDKAVEQLRTLLEKRPDNAGFHNDLGYILADNGRNLDEAEALVRKALELDAAERKKLREQEIIGDDEDKDNAAYLDSLGWVLFKKGRHAEAKKYLLEAVKDEDAQHAEIYDHLGDIHKALGEKADAIAAYEKALSLENVSRRDDARKDAVRKKLAELKE